MNHRPISGKNTTGSNISQNANIEPDMFTGEAPLQSGHKVWAKVQKDLSYALGSNVHRSWTGRLRVSDACPRTITLIAPSRFVASKIESAFADNLRRLWKKHDVVAPPRDVIISAHSKDIAKPACRSRSKFSAPNAPISAAAQMRAASPASDAAMKTSLAASSDAPSQTLAGPDTPRDRFTFDNFVVGPCNELAFAVARQTSALNATPYNPVVIHGANGMGKTHLLYAVKEAAEAANPGCRVHLISSEQFVNSFVSSVRGSGRDAIETFKSKLRNVDLLIIDDAHFIADKPGSQEELLHTLVSLVDDGRQILLASDRHPDQIDKASERLKSYLSSGLVCRIGAADYELRLRILDRLIDRRRRNGNPALAIPQNARDHLAARINATPRDLEGAFNQIVAQSEFLGTPITLDTIRETLSDSRYAAGQRLTVDKIQRAVCEEFGVTLNDMVSKRRARIIARPRQVAMYLSKKLTKRSLPDIGRRFGGRDHTTVMHAVKRIESLRADDPTFNSQIEAAEAALKR